MDELWRYRLALTFVKQTGNKTGRALLERYGTAPDIFKASLKELKGIEGMGEIRARAFRHEDVMQKAGEELEYIATHNITPLWIQDDNYPQRLKQCTDAPLVLYYKGAANLDAEKIVAIVGTRKSTDYGAKLTEELVAGLSSQPGLLITSGLADGIDTIAHKECLKRGIPTVGVLGHGHSRMYPAGNRGLAKDMQEQGGVLTEFSSGVAPDRENFPMRNRIVAGLSDVTVVVESDIKGGALITGHVAGSYNREVAAFPGRVTDKRSGGCNHLIRTNVAAMITCAEDLLELMNWGKVKKTKAVQKQLFINLTPGEQLLLELLQDKDAVHADDLFHKSGMNSSQLASTLLLLEMQGLVKTLPGKMYRVE